MGELIDQVIDYEVDGAVFTPVLQKTRLWGWPICAVTLWESDAMMSGSSKVLTIQHRKFNSMAMGYDVAIALVILVFTGLLSEKLIRRPLKR